jgi:hypothetical protein
MKVGTAAQRDVNMYSNATANKKAEVDLRR